MIDLTVIQFTSDVLVNQYTSLFVYVTCILVPLFGALSLMSK